MKADVTHNERGIWRAVTSTLVSQGFRILSLALSFISVPLYLRWIGEERYGLILTGSALTGYLMFSGGGLSWASMILIAHAHGRRDRETIQAIVRNSFSLSAISSMIVIVLVGIIYALSRTGIVLPFLPAHPEMPGLILALGASAVVALITSPFQNVFSGLQEISTVAVYQGVGTLANASLLLAAASTGLSIGWMIGLATMGSAACTSVAAIHCFYRHRWAFHWGSLWEKEHITAQFRSGAKCLLMQIGVVLATTAPTLSVSSTIGAQWVPYYTLPSTLLAIPLGVLLQLNMGLQPAYGQAFGRGDHEWIFHTVTTTARRVVTLLGVVGICFVTLSPTFIFTWTRGRITVGHSMLIGIFLSGAMSALATVYRTFLAGANRHKHAAFADLACGISTLLVTPPTVALYGVEASGYAAFGCMLSTLAWIFPLQFKTVVGSNHRVRTEAHFAARLFFVCAATTLLAIPLMRFTSRYGWLPEIAITTLATCSIYVCIGYIAGLDDCRRLARALHARTARLFQVAA